MAKNQEVLLSESDVFDVVNFANSIYNIGNFMDTNILNSTLNALQNNPLVPTRNNLLEALKDYKQNADKLRGYSEYAEVYDMIYGRVVEYYAGMLSFDLNIQCINAYSPKDDYKSEEYKQDLKRVYKFFDNFNYKEEFSKVLRNLLRSEVYYVWLRDSKGNFSDTKEIDFNLKENSKVMSTYTLQPMPQKYCTITALWEKGLLYDFDMSYFTQVGASLDSYDPVFKKYYKDVFENKQNIDFNKRTSPEDGAWVFKLNMSNLNETPFLSSLIKDVLTNEEVANLQRNVNIASAKGILAGEIPLLDKQKSGQVKDAMAWSGKTLENFMKLVKLGLSESVNAVAMPTNENKFYQFENKNPNMLENQLKISAGNGVSASRVIYSSDKVTKDELEAQITNDYNIVKKVYNQFNNFLDFYVNKKTRKYKFSFTLHGCSYPFMREREKKAILELADKGMVLNSSVYSGIVGMTPQDFDRSMEEAHYGGFSDKLTMLFSIHTQSGKNKEIGAPKKDDSELSEGGAIARDYDG